MKFFFLNENMDTEEIDSDFINDKNELQNQFILEVKCTSSNTI